MSHKTGIKTEHEPSKIIGIQFSILSPQEIRNSSVAEITSRDTYINNKPVIGGLFDPRMGVLESGLICPTDGLDYMQTPGYFGHIELARPVFYIQYFSSVLKILKCVCFKCSKLKINKEKYAYFLEKDSKKRFDAVYQLASKVMRCGDENDDGCGCKQPDKIKKEGFATINAEWSANSGNSENPDEKITMNVTPEHVIKIFRRISDEDVEFMGFSSLWSRPEWMVCQVLAVPPPAVRPSIKHDAQQRSEDDISHIIINIIRYNKVLQEKMEQNAPANVINDWTTILQYYIATMVNNKLPGVSHVTQRTGRPLKSIIERLNGKGGRVRGNLMGKRVDYSSRSVITPDANLSIRELGVPLKIAMNITYPVRVNARNKNYLTKLVINGPDKYPGAKILERKNGDNISLKYVDRESIVLEEGDFVHRHMVDGDPVLFNRQPTLHRMSMMGHIVKVMREGSTFRMNVGDTKPYNADFDGDEMNMHNPQDDESRSELRNLAAVPKQIISPANNKSIVGIFQDSLLGCYRFTREDIKFDTRTAMNILMAFNKVNENAFKNKKEITNFDILSQIFPPLSCKFTNSNFNPDEDDKKTSNSVIEVRNGQYIRGQINKGVLESMSKGFIQSIYNDFGYTSCADFIDDIQNIVTEYMKLSAYSVGISDLIANKETNDKIIDAITNKKQKVKDIIDQTHLGIFENNTGRPNNEEFETKINSVLNKAQEEAGKIGRKSLDKNNRFVIMVNAGSKGKPLNIAQMISCVGQQNVDGKRIPYGYEDRTLPHYSKYDDSPEARGFVESSFIQGLSPQELFFHAMGGRTGLIDTAVKTSTTGYIQRRLIKGMEDLKVYYDMTVRNNKDKIIQFSYGEDGIDTTKVEGQSINLATMSLEDIYAHFQIPDDIVKENIFTKETITRMKKQLPKFLKKTNYYIEKMIEYRTLLVENVFNHENMNKVYIPVSFSRIIENIKYQNNIQSNSLVDITPLELYELIEEKLKVMNMYYVKPTELFEMVYYYYLSPKDLLVFKKFNKKSIEIMINTIISSYKNSVVHPGEMVGMIAAQSIGEPTTQMTLNTFHFAGVASKSNVTRGVPRIDEILTLTENPKNPSLTISLPQEQENNNQYAQEVMYNLEFTNMQEIVKSVQICFDPNINATNIEEDREFLEQYNEFQKLVNDCANEEEEEEEYSKWIIRFEMDKEVMLDKNITMDDVHFTIQNAYKNEVNCVYSDLNSDKLIFRIRNKNVFNKKTNSSAKSLDQSDDIYKLKNIQENILNNVILRGVKNIKKVNIRKVQNNLVKTDDSYKVNESWVLDTVGTNMSDILANKNIDGNRTISNNIQEVYATLGIEAARQTIYNELLEVIEFDGTYINSHHIGLLCDRMCATTKLVSIFRHGINNDDIGPIAQASFEETPEMFLRAAKHGQLDNMKGVSSNVMCGQEGYFGTSSFQVYLDIDTIKENTQSKILTEKESIENSFKLEDENEPCSKTNLSINSSINTVKVTNTGNIDNNFDLDI